MPDPTPAMVDVFPDLDSHAIHLLACEVDHDLKNESVGLDRIRWNSRCVGALVKKVLQLELDLAAARDEFLNLRKLFDHAIGCVDRAFQVESGKPPPILPDFCKLGDDKFEAVKRLAKEFAAARAEIEQRKATIKRRDHQLNSAVGMLASRDRTLREAVGLLRDCKLRLRLVIENDSTMKYCCQPLIDGITTVLARLAELGLDK